MSTHESLVGLAPTAREQSSRTASWVSDA